MSNNKSSLQMMEEDRGRNSFGDHRRDESNHSSRRYHGDYNDRRSHDVDNRSGGDNRRHSGGRYNNYNPSNNNNIGSASSNNSTNNYHSSKHHTSGNNSSTTSNSYHHHRNNDNTHSSNHHSNTSTNDRRPPSNSLSNKVDSHPPPPPPVVYNGSKSQPATTNNNTTRVQNNNSTTIKPNNNVNRPTTRLNPLAERFQHIEKDIALSYNSEGKVGEGTYGEVYRAIDKRDGSVVAIKKIRIDPQREKEGFPITSIREIRILKEIEHKNIVKLLDVTWTKGTFFLVFEYVDHDLAGLNAKGHRFDEDELRSIMYQLLTALHCCHSRDIMHRDLKASNVLIKKDGTLKLADFGLSRIAQKNKQEYTNRVVTRWYRPPELLLGATTYDYAVDMWSVGCILGEMLLPFTGEKEPKDLFTGSDDVNQLEKIFEWCGTPSTEEWAEVQNLAHWNSLKPKEHKKRRLLERFSNLKSCSKKVLDLLDKLLVLNPAKRLSSSDCLNHDWFWEKGSLTNVKLKNLPSSSTNEFLTRKKGDNKPNAPSHQLPGSTSVQQLPHTIHQSVSSSHIGGGATSSNPFGSSASSSRNSHYNPSQSSHHHSHYHSTSSSHHGSSSHHNHQSSHHSSSSSNQSHSSHRDNRDNRYKDHDPPQRSNQLAPPIKKVKY